MYAHYDEQVDIAWFVLAAEPGSVSIASSEETEWGLIDRDSEGKAVGFEFWNASERFPKALLKALPAPSGGEVTIERQPA